MNLKNFKIVRSLNNISKLKWAMFSKLQDCKIASKYIDYLIPEDKKALAKRRMVLDHIPALGSLSGNFRGRRQV